VYDHTVTTMPPFTFSVIELNFWFHIYPWSMARAMDDFPRMSNILDCICLIGAGFFFLATPPRPASYTNK
jgi:hypothetical protein